MAPRDAIKVVMIHGEGELQRLSIRDKYSKRYREATKKGNEEMNMKVQYWVARIIDSKKEQTQVDRSDLSMSREVAEVKLINWDGCAQRHRQGLH
jgi:hypothetical protein